MELENENEDGSENINDSISSENSYDSGKENILFNIDVKLSGNKIAKLIISRIGENSELWLNSDTHQVDNKVYEKDNGIIKMIVMIV